MSSTEKTLDIIFADDALIIVNKPGGLLAVPGRGPGKEDCVTARAERIYPGLPPYPAVHRLDLQTSGLMILARTPMILSALNRQFEQRLVQKTYCAVLEGHITKSSGIIDLCFRLDPLNRPRQILDNEQGKRGITLWRKLSEEPLGTRVEFRPLTGRTHQLRLHAAHPAGLGVPIRGDYLYGFGTDGERMLLHATHLAFIHPVSKKTVSFQCEPPF